MSGGDESSSKPTSTSNAVDSTVHGSVVQARDIDRVSIVNGSGATTAESDLWRERHAAYAAFVDTWHDMRDAFGPLYANLRTEMEANEDWIALPNASAKHFRPLTDLSKSLGRMVSRIALLGAGAQEARETLKALTDVVLNIDKALFQADVNSRDQALYEAFCGLEDAERAFHKFCTVVGTVQGGRRPT